MHSISSGRQLAKPSHPELSNRVWELIKGCWKANSEKGKTISDVIAVLGAEANAKGGTQYRTPFVARQSRF